MNKAILLVLLAAMSFGFQEPAPNETCNNYRTTVHKCACGRAKMCGRGGHGSGDPDAFLEGPGKCKMSCKKDQCKCVSPCTSRGAH